MVVRYLLAVSLAISLTACTGNESPRETVKLSTAAATTSDTARAKTLTFTEAKIDSFELRYKKGDELHYRVRQYLEAEPDTARAGTQSTHVYTKNVLSARSLPKSAPFSVKVTSSSITGTSQSLLDVEGGYTISKKNAITMHVAATVVSPKGERNTVSQNQTARYEIELLP